MKLLVLALLSFMIFENGYSESFSINQNTKEEAVAENYNVSTEIRGAWINCRSDGSCRFSLCLGMEKKRRVVFDGYTHKQGHSPTLVTKNQWYASCNSWSEEFPIATEKNTRLIDLEIESLKNSIREGHNSDSDDIASNISDAQDIVSNDVKVLGSLLSTLDQSASDDGQGDQ